MKKFALVILLAGAAFGQASRPMTGREYFAEMKAADDVPRWATYACFLETDVFLDGHSAQMDDDPGFFFISRDSADLVTSHKQRGGIMNQYVLRGVAGDVLFFGPGQPYIWDGFTGDEKDKPFKIFLSINWKTMRYRETYSTSPLNSYGRCEKIYP